ncbi:hypothetical protein ACIQF6_03680 [Kitasatospora sp. NPDC092948]|uniref:hypothetical protein n=1 Tax=Kitasatospora sp. NPDC092948 TaxID=3364088 RepID=UPI0038303669
MRTISRLLGTAAAAAALLAVAALPASAATADFTATGTGASVPLAVQSAQNRALKQAVAAGFTAAQCVGTDASAWFDGELWHADSGVHCVS